MVMIWVFSFRMPSPPIKSNIWIWHDKVALRCIAH
jgi:hypothetical protein